MSGAGGGAQQAVHSLAFRVMRLCRPTLHVDTAPLKFDPCDILFGEDLFDDPVAASHLPRLLSSQSNTSVSDPSDLSYRSRFLLHHPTDSLGFPGLLVLPQAFGYISINNSSNFEVRDVIIKAEIQTERQRIVLLDTSKAPVESIRAGGRYDFIVEHDVKELGAHTLVCTALYSDGDSERKYLPQFFKFIVSNPLSVRTKVRNVKVRCGVVKVFGVVFLFVIVKSLFSQETTFLEACIENHTKANLYMDQVEFEPAQHWSVTALKTADHALEHNLLMGSLAIFSYQQETFKEPVLIRSGGGIYNYLYELKFSSPHSGQVKVEGSNILPITRKEIEGDAVDAFPIYLDKPFLVSLKLINLTERVLGPFEVWLSESDLLNEKAVMVNGLQTMNLIATKHGIQKISGITVFDTVEKKTYSSLLELEIYVDSQ
ncbi:UNVERIFIED_CONTAM: Trafficking protein particle complex subunit [Sesamum angustifolium]|uniref:Trafficking protein particle complex subunit n=1 Tax=Sesamum angustifolium TaxID=2727405 RepID=A0AAW2KVT8_9LAMI